jgi:hypothetical protein
MPVVRCAERVSGNVIIGCKFIGFVNGHVAGIRILKKMRPARESEA